VHLVHLGRSIRCMASLCMCFFGRQAPLGHVVAQGAFVAGGGPSYVLFALNSSLELCILHSTQSSSIYHGQKQSTRMQTCVTLQMSSTTVLETTRVFEWCVYDSFGGWALLVVYYVMMTLVFSMVHLLCSSDVGRTPSPAHAVF